MNFNLKSYINYTFKYYLFINLLKKKLFPFSNHFYFYFLRLHINN